MSLPPRGALHPQPHPHPHHDFIDGTGNVNLMGGHHDYAAATGATMDGHAGMMHHTHEWGHGHGHPYHPHPLHYGAAVAAAGPGPGGVEGGGEHEIDQQQQQPPGAAGGGGGGGVQWHEGLYYVDESGAADTPTLCRFDPYEELIWLGTRSSRLCSLSLPNLARHTAFPLPGDGSARGLVFGEEGVLALTDKCLHFCTRGGAPMTLLEHGTASRLCSEGNRLLAMDIYHRPHSESQANMIVCGGERPTLFFLDINLGTLAFAMDLTHGVYSMCAGPSHLCLGGTDGRVSFMDYRVPKVVCTLAAHSGYVTSVTEQGPFVATCGVSPSARGGKSSIDDTASVSVPMPYGASCCRFHPSLPTYLIVASGSGFWQTVQLDPDGVTSQGEFSRIPTLQGSLQSFDISSNGMCLAFSDSSQGVHLYVADPSSPPQANAFSNPTLMPTVTHHPVYASQPIDTPDGSSLWGPIHFSSPLCETGDPLLSDTWGGDGVYAVGQVRPPVDLPEGVLSRLKMVEFMGHAQNTEGWPTNSFVFGVAKIQDRARGGAAAKRGKRGRRGGPQASGSALEKVTEEGAGEFGGPVPAKYRFTPVTLTKLGVEHFNFAAYNRTHFAGLENGSPFDFMHPLLMFLYFIPHVKDTLTQHVCEQEFCLGCELGFLFHMLDLAREEKTEWESMGRPRSSSYGGQLTCQTTNFLRAFKQSPEASVLGAPLRTRNICVSHSHEQTLSGRTFVTDLVYPQPPTQTTTAADQKQKGAGGLAFSEGYCKDCQKQTRMRHIRELWGYPQVLALNCNAHEQTQASVWRAPSFLPPCVHIQVPSAEDGTVAPCVRVDPLPGCVPYDLIGVIFRVAEEFRNADTDTHLVLHVRVPASYQGQQQQQPPRQQQESGGVAGSAVPCSPPIHTGGAPSDAEFVTPMREHRGDVSPLFSPSSFKSAQEGDDTAAPPTAAGGDKVKVVVTPAAPAPADRSGARAEWDAAAGAAEPPPSAADRAGDGDGNGEGEGGGGRGRENGVPSPVLTHQAEPTTLFPEPSTASTRADRPSHSQQQQQQRQRHVSTLSGVSTLTTGETDEQEQDQDEECGQPTTPLPPPQQQQQEDDKQRAPEQQGPVAQQDQDQQQPQPQQQQQQERGDRWLTFNDFVITPSDLTEVVDFTADWKVPACAFYARRGTPEPPTTTTSKEPPVPVPPSGPSASPPPPCRKRQCPISLTLFQTDENLSQNQHALSSPPSFTRLGQSEIARLMSEPQGLLVALDAEFVALELEAAEIREDGSKLVLKPSHLSLARVSVVRGEGPLEGVPLIDHYIHTKDTVRDYLTRFSGLKPGDLDPLHCRHWLTTKKSIYQKLRFLVDMGCRFVGHGLRKDFRIINILVPSHQIIDTVDLFYLPGQRRLSLKFLAAHLLNTAIQQGTHDSVEDAKTALRIYRRWEELQASGLLHDVIRHLYGIGYQSNWKV
ncbi:unnamed protein product [Vitrella brassicaformis CCMP3155]|uniref:Exonuclease domain-containing protein n=5 Tax=Vitrella brassicaformis TaxID=1169539 RepID=A0A0G4GDX9_VITBC|nr:unnamed protein product [Vitrella brassicaformis CCMP3155]|eukprot:CEM27187.1 unnamed protein product [Vitrella brassicaformis CCMP3155]